MVYKIILEIIWSDVFKLLLAFGLLLLIALLSLINMLYNSFCERLGTNVIFIVALNQFYDSLLLVRNLLACDTRHSVRVGNLDAFILFLEFIIEFLRLPEYLLAIFDCMLPPYVGQQLICVYNETIGVHFIFSSSLHRFRAFL